jgi:hypothetical protein
MTNHDGPAAIGPDTKSWTWVLDQACPECGLDLSTFTGREVPTMIRDSVPRWRTVLARADVRKRPEATVWSPLEYACHARDVFRVFRTRVGLMLTEDSPVFARWDQDEAANRGHYWEEDPATVAKRLASTGEALAVAFDQVTDDGWSRVGRRSDGAQFTVDSLARYFVHDLVHHLYDVRG